MNYFPLFLRYISRGFILIATFIGIYTALAWDVEVIDPLWSLSTDPLQGHTTIVDEKINIDKEISLDSLTLSHFTQPTLRISPSPRIYGEIPNECYISTPLGVERFHRGVTPPGKFLYVPLQDSKYALVGYTDNQCNAQPLDNQRINASIIQEALETPRVPTPMSSLPHELISHTSSFLPKEDSYNFLIALLTDKELAPIAKEVIVHKLIELQKEEPLEVDCALLDKLIPYEEYIIRMEFTDKAA